MIPVLLIILVGVALLSLSVLWLLRRASLNYADVRERLHRPEAELLTYDVPNGQDPADVMIALRHAGYTSVEDLTGGMRRVLVACPGDRNRARPCVRAVIEAVGFPTRAGVRFVDEPEWDQP